MTPELERLVRRLNPWRQDPALWDSAISRHLPPNYIPREAEKAFKRICSAADRAHLVIGPRQAGKSTLIWHVLRSRDRGLLYLNCDEPLVREWCTSAALFLSDLEDKGMKVGSLFLEEVQRLREPGLFVKGLVDMHPGFPVLVTGSSSFHLGEKARESLAGRASRTSVFPFCLDEAAVFPDNSSEEAKNARMEAAFLRHVRFGGYPEAWLAEAPEELLQGLVDALVVRDASDRFRVRYPHEFRKLLKLAAMQVGNMVNVSEWSGILEISRDAVRDYLDILEETHIIKLLPVFAGGKRAEIVSRPKPYFVDNGLRDLLLDDFRPLGQRVDDGPTLENWVFSELHKKTGLLDSLGYWRTKGGAEVDFVWEKGRRRIGIEVKCAAMNRPKLSRSARAFIEAYRPDIFLVVNRRLRHREKSGGTVVVWVTAWRMLDPLRELLYAS